MKNLVNFVTSRGFRKGTHTHETSILVISSLGNHVPLITARNSWSKMTHFFTFLTAEAYLKCNTGIENSTFLFFQNFHEYKIVTKGNCVKMSDQIKHCVLPDLSCHGDHKSSRKKSRHARKNSRKTCHEIV